MRIRALWLKDLGLKVKAVEGLLMVVEVVFKKIPV